MMIRHVLAPLCGFLLLGACVPADLTPTPDAGSTMVADMKGDTKRDMGDATKKDMSVVTRMDMNTASGDMTGGGGFGGKNPFEGKPEEAQAAMDGKTLYSGQCIGCHGADGKMATFGAGAILKETGDTKMDDFIYDTISNGIKTSVGQMSAYKGSFSEEEIWKIVTFIRSIE